MVGGLLWVAFRSVTGSVLELAKAEARSAFNKDLVYRKWASLHGGVYVPVTADTPPNPFLAHVPERDLTTASGRRLTLLNPAYMTRQVLELGREQYGLRGHITSLKPLRPENRADAWEAEALGAFAGGAGEVAAIAQLEDRPFLRLMRPLVTQKDCLKCHAVQGYREGDLRGGISVSLPYEGYLAIAGRQRRSLLQGYGLLWLLGLTGIGAGARRLRGRLEENRRAALEIHRLNEDLESRVLARTRELEETNRELESFSASVSHDLRAPLQAMAGHADILLHRLEGRGEPELLDCVSRIQDRLGHTGAMIEGLLRLAKVSRGPLKLEAVDMAALVGAVRGNLEPAGSRVQWELGPLPPARGDAVLFEQVWSNLVANALKYASRREVPTIRIAGRREAGSVVYVVEDNGVGFDPREAEGLFEAFRRLGTARDFEGTGVGLALVQRILKRYGGRIWAESAPGQGARFSFRLPD